MSTAVQDRSTARYVEHVMGMPISLALRGRHTDDAAAREAWAAALGILRAADRVFSTYRSDSAVARLDRGELTLHQCPPEVTEVLALADVAEHQSGGAFSVRLPGPDGRVRLDPSGVVKGWAAQRAADVLAGLPGTDLCLSAGGDVTCRTLDEAIAPWRIGIENPADPGRVIAVVEVRNGAVATSGAAHRGAHVVDARTGRAPHGVASVTVLARSLLDADIDATAAYARGRDAARWLGQRPGRSGLVVWADATTTVVSSGVPSSG